jgi:mannopine transport system substrate-binding protein
MRGITGIVSKLAGAAVAATIALSAPVHAQSNEVVVVTTGGAYGALLDRLFFKPFTDETGIAVRQVSASTAEAWAKLAAMAQVGKVEWDLLSGLDADLLARRDIVAEIDCSKLPITAEMALPDTCRDYGVVRVVGSNGTLTYSTEEFPNGGPQTWADLFDTEKFPGPRGLMDSGTPWDMLAIALLADGVPADKLYPLDLDRAFAKLDKIKPNVAVWWKSGDQSQQMFRSGEVVAGVLWSGRAFMLEKEGTPVKAVIPGSIRANGYWMVAKNAPNGDNALKLIDHFMKSPEAHVAFRRENFNDTMNKAAMDLLTPEERAAAITSPENLASLVVPDYKWIAANREAIMERWKMWIAQ